MGESNFAMLSHANHAIFCFLMDCLDVCVCVYLCVSIHVLYMYVHTYMHYVLLFHRLQLVPLSKISHFHVS